MSAVLVAGEPGRYVILRPLFLVGTAGALLVSPFVLLWFWWRPKPASRVDRVIIGVTVQAIAGCLAIWLWFSVLRISGLPDLLQVAGDVTAWMMLTGVAVALGVGCGLLALRRWVPRYLLPLSPGGRLVAVVTLDAVAVATAVVLLGGPNDPAAFVALAAGGVLAALCVFWWLPSWQSAQWPAGVDDKARVEFEGHNRASVAQLIGGLGLIATLALTVFQVNEARKSSERTLVLTARGQLNDRFSRAVDQMGALTNGKPAVEQRLGGLYALQQYVVQAEAAGSEDDAAVAYRTAAAILSAYVRANAPYRAKARAALKDPGSGCARERRANLRPDVAAAIAVIRELFPAQDATDANDYEKYSTMPDYRYDGPALDLSGTDLMHADLTRTDLRSADLRGSRLAGANLRETSLAEAKLAAADARRACFVQAMAFRATFTEGNKRSALVKHAAKLQGARFGQAILDSADLRYTNLTGAAFNGAELFSAKGTGATLNGTGLLIAADGSLAAPP
jgi:pentapeptide repeat protein